MRLNLNTIDNTSRKMNASLMMCKTVFPKVVDLRIVRTKNVQHRPSLVDDEVVTAGLT